MRKIIIIAVLVLMAMFSLNAETYSVKYKNEFGNTERAYYTVTEEDKNFESSSLLLFSFKATGTKFEVIDEDSELSDLVIVNKLDKQGYKAARDEFTFRNVKYTKYWMKINGIWYIVRE